MSEWFSDNGLDCTQSGPSFFTARFKCQEGMTGNVMVNAVP
jgi:hypothetical protein